MNLYENAAKEICGRFETDYIMIDYCAHLDASVSEFKPDNLDNSFSFIVNNDIFININLLRSKKYRSIDDDWQVSKIGGDVG